MKKILLLVAAVVVLLVLIVAIIAMQVRKETPAFIVERLRSGDGDREQLIMQFKLARGDRVPAMIAAFNDTGAPLEFRALFLDMLFAHQNREPDTRIPPVLNAALHADDPAVRQHAVHGYAFFAEPDDQVALINVIDDSNRDVRLQALMVINAVTGRAVQNPEQGFWRNLEEERQVELARRCLELSQTEDDEKVRFQLESVVGRRVEILTRRARTELQAGNLDQAEQLLTAADMLAPKHHQVGVGMVQLFLASGEKEKALAVAETYGVLMRIPRLPEAPVIDGDPTDSVWDVALTNRHGFYRNSRWAPLASEGKSKAYIGHREGKLYVAVIGYEDDLTQLRVTRTQRDDRVWEDDCVELFFDPQRTDSKFYQFIINPLNTVEDQYDRNGKHNFACQSGAQIFSDRGYWACEFVIDASTMKTEISADSLWGISINRTRIGPGAEQTGWWPTFGGTWSRPELCPYVVFDIP